MVVHMRTVRLLQCSQCEAVGDLHAVCALSSPQASQIAGPLRWSGGTARASAAAVAAGQTRRAGQRASGRGWPGAAAGGLTLRSRSGTASSAIDTTAADKAGGRHEANRGQHAAAGSYESSTSAACSWQGHPSTPGSALQCRPRSNRASCNSAAQQLHSEPRQPTFGLELPRLLARLL